MTFKVKKIFWDGILGRPSYPGTYYVAKVSFELLILVLPLAEHWD